MEIINNRVRLVISTEELVRINELGMMNVLADLVLECSGDITISELDKDYDCYTDEDISIKKMYKTLIDNDDDLD